MQTTCTINVVASGFGGISFRVQDASNYCFCFLDPAGNFQLFEIVAGVLAGPKATISVTINTGTDYNVAVSSIGGAITATLNGGSQISYTTTNFLAATKFGLYNQGATTGTQFDNRAAYVNLIACSKD